MDGYTPDKSESLTSLRRIERQVHTLHRMIEERGCVMTSAIYEVTGMNCGNCVRAVTGELSGLGGVVGVTVDLVPGGRSAVMVTSEIPLSASVVAAALDEAGGFQLTTAHPA